MKYSSYFLEGVFKINKKYCFLFFKFRSLMKKLMEKLVSSTKQV